MEFLDPNSVKKRSEQRIVRAGGRICSSLPALDPRAFRAQSEIADRALVLVGLVHIYFYAPIDIVRDWISRNDLEAGLTSVECKLLQKKHGYLSDKDRDDLYWLIESLWAFSWVFGLIRDIPFNKGVGDELASLWPNLERDDSASLWRGRLSVRASEDLFGQLDLYYRLHWWLRDESLHRREVHGVDLPIVQARRRTLEWVCDSGLDWEATPTDT